MNFFRTSSIVEALIRRELSPRIINRYKTAWSLVFAWFMIEAVLNSFSVKPNHLLDLGMVGAAVYICACRCRGLAHYSCTTLLICLSWPEMVKCILVIGAIVLSATLLSFLGCPSGAMSKVVALLDYLCFAVFLVRIIYYVDMAAHGLRQPGESGSNP